MIIILDTTILGAITNPTPKSPTVQATIRWAVQLRQVGHTFAIPSIAVYEIKRELLRNGSTASVTALDTFVNASTNIYLPITDNTLNCAARLWADICNAGQMTAKDAALDGDVILMAQILEAGYAATAYVLATDNLKHFQSWVNADNWQNIVP